MLANVFAMWKSLPGSPVLPLSPFTRPNAICLCPLTSEIVAVGVEPAGSPLAETVILVIADAAVFAADAAVFAFPAAVFAAVAFASALLAAVFADVVAALAFAVACSHAEIFASSSSIDGIT